MNNYFLNNPFDISPDFESLDNEYFLPGAIANFNEKTGKGQVIWQYHRYVQDWFFNKIDKHLEKQTQKEAPFQDYDVHPVCDFDVSFITPRTMRLRMSTSPVAYPEKKSLMIPGTLATDSSRLISKKQDKVVYQNEFGSVVVNTKSFEIIFRDEENKILTATQTVKELKAMHSKAKPFSFMKRSSDYARSIAASFSLAPGEKIYGCGESFTALNKRGQKIVLFATDAQSSASPQMYKPVPFFMSSRGYGIFVHTSAPLTFDFGNAHASTTTLFSGDEQLDLFFFTGTPQQILAEYTALTGRSPLPPLWSFGLWMGCFSYTSEKEVKEVAVKMRKNEIPCDVIHIDAGWFEKGINCDFLFNSKSFPEPKKMIAFLRENGFRTSLWQIPYFTPHNPLFTEVVEKKLYIKNANGTVPTEDAILDFSNEHAVKWYAEKLKQLLNAGIAVIKVDFGEAAPLAGLYASGTTGIFEHNLYPLRYNKLVSELTKSVNGEDIIWARSAWAGSQKYPVHWGGDAEVSDAGMAGSLRGGLSLGLSGFSFWSHDIGGFSGSPVEELYTRWAFFGLMGSHSRVHGFPPREPWKFSRQFLEQFRKMAVLRYRLIPYLYTQAFLSSKAGLPLMRALLMNYPDDPAVWEIEDQYLLGNDVLVAPVMETRSTSRQVYLPEGKWINYESKEILDGMQWHKIDCSALPGILLLRYGALIPVAPLVQCTAEINWQKLEWIACSDGATTSRGSLFLPGAENVVSVQAAPFGDKWDAIQNEANINFSIKGIKHFS